MDHPDYFVIKKSVPQLTKFVQHFPACAKLVVPKFNTSHVLLVIKGPSLFYKPQELAHLMGENGVGLMLVPDSELVNGINSIQNATDENLETRLFKIDRTVALTQSKKSNKFERGGMYTTLTHLICFYVRQHRLELQFYAPVKKSAPVAEVQSPPVEDDGNLLRNPKKSSKTVHAFQHWPVAPVSKYEKKLFKDYKLGPAYPVSIYSLILEHLIPPKNKEHPKSFVVFEVGIEYGFCFTAAVEVRNFFTLARKGEFFRFFTRAHPSEIYLILISSAA